MLLKLDYLAFVFACFVSFSLRQVEGLNFSTVPQNATIRTDQPIRLNCSVDGYDDTGMQWVYGEERKVIYSEVNGEEVFTLPGLKVERPDNWTRNLVILHPNASSVGKYCCQHTNGAGKRECAFVTEENATWATEVSVTQEPVTSVLPTTEAGKSDGDSQKVIIGSIVGPIVSAILVIVLVVVGYICYKRKSQEERRRNGTAGTSVKSPQTTELLQKENNP